MKYKKLLQSPSSSCILLLCLSLFWILPLRSEGLIVPLLPVDADKMCVVPGQDIPDWNVNPDLVDTTWTPCLGGPGGIGFDSNGDYADLISLDLSADMAGRQTTCYVRGLFDVSADLLSELDYLALKIRYDDGFVAYLNGDRVAAANAPTNLHRRSNASATHEAKSLIWFDISNHLDKLHPGQNLLAIQGLNVSGSSPDFLVQFELVGRKNYANHFQSTLPILVIETENGFSVETSSIQSADLKVFHNSASINSLKDPVTGYNGSIAISGVANSTDTDKIHYSFTLGNKDNPVSQPILGFPEGDEWILYAPYNDKTLFRNVLTGQLAQRLGRGNGAKLCHLFLNEDYRGLYTLLEKANHNRLNISILEPGAADGDIVSGGYILSLGRPRLAPGFDSPLLPFRNAPFPIRYLYTYPDAGIITGPQTDYIQSFMNVFESDPLSVLDVASAADYFLINEFAKNTQAYRDNMLLYKDKNSKNPGLFIHSPLDFNSALGNQSQYAGSLVEGWQLDYLKQSQEQMTDSLFMPMWWQQVFAHDQFRSAVFERWHDLTETFFNEETVTGILDSLYETSIEDRVLNFECWPILGFDIQPNGYVGESYDEDFDYLYLWVIDRLDWMREAMVAFQTDVNERPASIHEFSLSPNFPNPFNPNTTLYFSIPTSGWIRLEIYNSRGQQVKTLVSGNLSAGLHRALWNGTNFNNNPLQSGVYVIRLTMGDRIKTRKLLLLQ